ncbi:serine/threonine protein kinase [Actinomadura rudentiformis]|uniref:Serine/threonine protein kinase n=1 Tax=Actinomadura rudentiformis TaxID=359158 RepID=A0A6H9YGT3_9ACTN|nr:serine/threonine protein kinase [Actinomadura rudentiformis]KAB2344128.1 serine/threonine protein kinase [Actinomadura rudentiformis]
MRGVIVQLPAAGRTDAAVIRLAVGQEASFGRGTAKHPVDLELSDAGVPRWAGVVRAVEDHWTISNLSRHSTYVIENPEGGGEFVKVSPRRLDMPVPFEFSRVALPVRQGSVDFLVFASQHRYAEHAGLEPDSGEVTAAAFALDESAKYFLVLVALCEPRLRNPSTVMIPTIPEIIERIRPIEGCRDLTRSAVKFHIDYLAGTKLQVRDPALERSGIKADWRREALVSLALRFDLVREEHLALLPPPAAPARFTGPHSGSSAGFR